MRLSKLFKNAPTVNIEVETFSLINELLGLFIYA